MAYAFSMQYLQTLQNLPRNLASLCLCRFAVFHIFAQIPVLDVLHRYKYITRIFVPANEFNEQVFVLDVLV